MRVADSPSAECDQLIEASPATIWGLVTDIDLPARFSPELQRVSWLDDASGPRLGATFEGVNQNDILGEWRTVSVVTEMEEPLAFAWAVVDADGFAGPANTDPAYPAATWRFDLQSHASATTLRLSVRIGPAPSGLNLVIEKAPEHEEEIVESRLGMLRDGMRSTLTGIKELAEAPASL